VIFARYFSSGHILVESRAQFELPSPFKMPSMRF
jgi:hypothetical protein